MWRSRLEVPLEVQFQAACAAASVFDTVKVYELLGPYGYRERANPDTHAENRLLQKYLRFTPGELLAFFKRHRKECNKLFNSCGDKRYSPSSFISQLEGGGYDVGMFDIPDGEQKVQRWATLAEAITDYVLVSLDMPRLEGGKEPPRKRQRTRR